MRSSSYRYKPNECQALTELCCFEQLSIQNCQKGVAYAKESSKIKKYVDCSLAGSYRGDVGPEYRCCLACQMALVVSETHQLSGHKRCSAAWLQSSIRNLTTFSSLISNQIESAFGECCKYGFTIKANSVQDDGK